MKQIKEQSKKIFRLRRLRSRHPPRPHWQRQTSKEQDEPVYEIEYVKVGKRFATRTAPDAPYAVKDVNVQIQPGEVLLLDEPFSALDAQTKMVLQQDLAQSLFEQKKTALLITHDLVVQLVEFPSAMPAFFSGLRIASTLAVIGVTVGELVGGNKGLGFLLVDGEGQGNTAAVFVAIAMLTVIGIIAYGAVVWVENKVLHYMPKAHGKAI